jgi:hypothetical protein
MGLCVIIELLYLCEINDEEAEYIEDHGVGNPGPRQLTDPCVVYALVEITLLTLCVPYKVAVSP